MADIDESRFRDPLPTDWIIVRNWERFQHYKDRGPTWIKLYTSLLRNPKYLELSMGSRGLLHTIWMLFAVENGTIRVQDCAHFAHKRVSNVQLVSLNHAGFIDFSASKPLALSTEKETERSLELPVENSETPKPVVRHRANQPSLLVEAFEALSEWQGTTTEEFNNLLEALERRRREHLRESDRHKLWDHVLKRLND